MQLRLDAGILVKHPRMALLKGIEQDRIALWEETLAQQARVLPKGRALVMEGDRFAATLVVLEGWLALSKSLADGQKQIIDFALPGDIVVPTSARGDTALVSLEAQTDVSLSVVPNKEWEKLVKAIPALAAMTRRAEAATQARRAERALRLGKGSAEMRVAEALMEFCVRLGASCDAVEPIFHVPLTQQALGDFLGLSSVHVCRTMRRLSRNGVVQMSDHMDIHVLRTDILSEIAGIELQALRQQILP